MKSQTLIRCALMLAATAPLAAQASPLGMKPGAWETSITMKASGMQQKIDIPKDQLAKMPPEQRAQVENAIKLQKGEPVTMTKKHCVKDSDSIEKMMADAQREGCKREIISQTSSLLDMKLTCSNQRGTSTVHIKMEATSAESVNTTMDMDAGNGVKMHQEGKGHWLSASCAGIPDSPRPARH